MSEATGQKVLGRPKVVVDSEVVYKLAKLGCTNEEIGDFFSCSAETIRTRFRDVLSLGRTSQKMSLRRAQMKRAQAGSDAMLIHLGKHVLGQNDVSKADDDGRDDKRIRLPDVDERYQGRKHSGQAQPTGEAGDVPA